MLFEVFETELVGAVAIQRRQPAEQYEVAAAVGCRGFDREHVGRRLDHANGILFAARILADGAQFGIRKIAATAAMPDPVERGGNRLGDSARALLVALEQVQGHALR